MDKIKPSILVAQNQSQCNFVDSKNSDHDDMLLVHIVQLLAEQKGQPRLLSDLGGSLSESIRHCWKDNGVRLRGWLLKYPNYFAVRGQPGKESVTLIGGDRCLYNALGTAGTAPLGVDIQAGSAQSLGESAKESSRDGDSVNNKEDDDDANDSAVQLRGLPYKATITDIKQFLGPLKDHLKSKDAIQIVQNRDGRPSGFAKVQFTSPLHAKAARDTLHRQVMVPSSAGQSSATAQSPTDMSVGQNEGQSQTPTNGGVSGTPGQSQTSSGDRYVEIFLFSERPSKLRTKRTMPGDSTVTPEEAQIVTKDEVLMECRKHMMMPGRAMLLLSMLGVALSAAAHAYLKKTEQGLKHFLSQFPKEFVIDGAKGSEHVKYLGCQESPPLPAPGTSWPAPPSPWSDAYLRPVESTGLGNTCVTVVTPNSATIPESITSNSISAGFNNSPWSGWPFSQGANWPAMHNMPAHWFRPMSQENQRHLSNVSWGREGMTQYTSAAMNNFDVAAALTPAQSPSLAPAAPPNPSKFQHATQPEVMQGPSHDGCWNDKPQQAWKDLMNVLGVEPEQRAHAPQSSQDPESQNARSCEVQLCGFPPTFTEQDVLIFFAKYDIVHLIVEESKAVEILTSSGEICGLASVQMRSSADADYASKVLNGQRIADRLIVVSQRGES